MRSMGISHRHAFSCDIDPSVQKYIRACCPPDGPLFDDMLRRAAQDVPAHSVYVCGFPCTPFSSLRGHSTRLFGEAAARPFFAAVKFIREHLPALAVAENVPGIAKVMKRVVSAFTALRWYRVLVIFIDPTTLGEPVRRPRYYFVLVRQDVAALTDAKDIEEYVQTVLAAAARPCTDTVAQRMLPAHHLAVRQCLATQPGTTATTRERRGGEPKWAKHHADFRRMHGAPSSRVSSVAGLRSSRCQDSWRLLSRAHSSAKLVADVSQSIHRATVRVDGVCPTIARNSVIVVAEAGRIMVPLEKLLVHNFPLHKMKLPCDVTATTLSNLGGNTMHLASIGLALLIGIGLIDWSKNAASPGQKPRGHVPRAPGVIVFPRSAAPASSQKRQAAKASARRAKRVRR